MEVEDRNLASYLYLEVWMLSDIWMDCRDIFAPILLSCILARAPRDFI